jgi:transcriptional regulator with XRE-family HTH domain
MSGTKTFDAGLGLAERLKTLRQERGWTHRQLAEMAGVSPSHIGSIESGKVTNPGAYQIYRVALALRVPMEDLLGLSRLASRTRMRTQWEGKTVEEIIKENPAPPILSPDE